MRMHLGGTTSASCGVLCLIAALASAAPAAVHDLEWSAGTVILTEEPDGRMRVEMSGASSIYAPGAPDLPWVTVRIPVEPGREVGEWSWTPGAYAPIEAGIEPVPGILDRPSIDGGPIAVEPDPAIYRGTTAWPAEPARYLGTHARAGRLTAAFLICPFRWEPGTGRLEMATGGRLEASLIAAQDAQTLAPPERTAPARLDARLRGRMPSGGTILHNLGDGLAVSNRPSLDSRPVEFLIVTDTTFVTAFQPLVEWKNRIGSPAAVRTMQWVEREYPHGVDGAERLRLFLIDAYRYWGTTTVLLGGDPTFVPIRYARSWIYPEGIDIATDTYYACLDGNWNADGDELFGEGYHRDRNPRHDEVDFVPELRVGRISARDVSQIQKYLSKYTTYTRAPDRSPGYLDNVLVLGEVLFQSGWQFGDRDSCNEAGGGLCVSYDGATDCFTLIDSMKASPDGDFFQFDELYERHYWWNPYGHNSRRLDKDNTIGSLNAGRNIVYHMGHGDRDRWAIGFGRLLVSDIMGLTNAPKYAGLAYVVNCNSAAVDADCMGEAWQFAPNGGGLVYIGSTNLDFPHTARPVQNDFFHDWLADPDATPGDAWWNTFAKFGAQIRESDTPLRFLLHSLIFLGDPDMPVWRTFPSNATVTAPAEIPLGTGSATVLVAVDGTPVEGARVCLYKANDALAVGLTGANGSVSIPFDPTTTGLFRVTVTHHSILPAQSTGNVVGSQAISFVALDEYSVVDDGSGSTVGNGNGRIEAGETVALSLEYTNRGSFTAAALTAALEMDEFPSDLDVEILDGEEALPNLGVGASAQAESAFLIRVTAPDFAPRTHFEEELPLRVRFEASDASRDQEIRPRVYRPDLLLFATRIVEETVVGDPDSLPDAGEVLAVSVELYNRGHGTWSALRGRLVASFGPSVVMIDSLAAIPEVGPGEVVRSEPMRFEVRTANNLRMNFILEDTLGTSRVLVWSRLLNLGARPYVPEDLAATGGPGSIQVAWDEYVFEPRPIWGYRVLRAANADGPYEPLGTGFIQGIRTLVDGGLGDMDGYYYKVAAVDSSGLESRYTEPLLAYSAPGTAPGWPVYIAESRDAAPALQNVNGWGPDELLISSDVLYAFQGTGAELVDGDNNPATVGVFNKVQDAQAFLGKVAVYDIDGDGENEVIAVPTNGSSSTSWNPPASLVTFGFTGEKEWSKSLLNRPVLSAPAIGNIDGDSEMEIVFSAGKWIYAFNHDGTPVGGVTDGKIYPIPVPSQFAAKVDWQVGSPALANLDLDPEDEIIYVNRADSTYFVQLHVFNGDGSSLPGFPVRFSDITGTNMQESATASVAIADVTSHASSGFSGASDGKADIIVATRARLWVFDPWATSADKLVWHIPLQVRADADPLSSSPAVGDIDGDGNLDIAVGGGTGYLYVVDGRGNALEGFYENAAERYRKIGNIAARMSSPVLGDLNGDGRPEVVIGDNQGNVYALHGTSGPGYAAGDMMTGFPYQVPGGKIGSGLLIWDVDRDGYTNLVIQADKVQQIRVLHFPNSPFDLSDPDHAAAFPWPQFRHNPQNTGFVEGEQPTPVETVVLEAQTDGALRVDLRWQTGRRWMAYRLDRRPEPEGEWQTLGQWAPEEIEESPGVYSIGDEAPAAGDWSYRLTALDLSGGSRVVGEAFVTLGRAAVSFALHPALPNPFGTHTSIRLDLPSKAPVRVEVLDASGRIVRRIHDGSAGPGSIVFGWNGADDDGRALGAGVYFVRAEAAGEGSRSRKVVLLH